MSRVPNQVLEKTAFGELSTAEKTPVTQILAINGLTDKVETFSFLGGTATTNDSEFVCSTGTNANSFASIITSRELPYRAGQGNLCMMTARFAPGVADSLQIAGFTSATDSLSFAYFGTQFGIQRRSDGKSEIQELLITSATTGAGDVTVTVDGNPYTVAVTVDTVQVNALEISDSLSGEAALANWTFTSNDDTVVAMSTLAQPAGAFAFALDTATGTAAAWAQIEPGALANTQFIPQEDWNIDPRISTDVDVNLNPTKGNVYAIKVQYLGYGGIRFFVEDKQSGEFVAVHFIEYANTNVVPNLGDPTFRVGWSIVNTGNVTDITIAGASAGAFIEGKDVITETPRALTNTLVGVGVVANNLLTIRNRIARGDRRNRADNHLIEITGFTDSSKGATIDVLLNATVLGNPDYHYVDKVNSITEYDITGTVVTGGTNIATITLPPGGGGELNLSMLLAILIPGDTLTLAASVVATPSADITATIVFQEDI